MIGFITGKEVTKTSKRIIIKNSKLEEIKYLINNISDDVFNKLKVNSIISFDVNGDWRGIPIIVSLESDENIINETYKEESDLLKLIYSPKPVPKLKIIMNKMIDFINNTNDDSNINSSPRHVEFDDLQTAITNYLTDVKIIEDENGALGYNTKDRLTDFIKCPASTAYHDHQEGGLLRHIAKMIDIIIGLTKGDIQEYSVHPMALMISTFVHDLGKIDQYSKDESGNCICNKDAKLKGCHLGISLERWASKGKQFLIDIKVKPSDIEEMYWNIWHIIGSHHGSVHNGFGSAWDPNTVDAWTLHSVDLLESRQNEDYQVPRTE